jgi:ADP-ribose pyrophosphatase YjhB (NUDIX family)
MESVNVYNPHVSVDCVVFGFDGEKLKVLLIERTIDEPGEQYNDKKLPGSIIYENENLDEAASRVLGELTGLRNIYLSQFKSFGDPKRTSNPRDIYWLENTTKMKIGRIVTVGYVALIKINRKIKLEEDNKTVQWYDVKDIDKINLAFDHNEIIHAASEHIRHTLKVEPRLMFELLPRKFTMSQLRILYDVIHQTHSDVRNFQKKMMQLHQLVMLDEVEKNVPHRAARLYKFDRKKL